MSLSMEFNSQISSNDSYLRNNKAYGEKLLRCFPECCSKGHCKVGFCGTSMNATLKVSSISDRFEDGFFQSLVIVGEMMPSDSEPSLLQHTIVTESMLNLPATYSKYYRATISTCELDSDSNHQTLSLDFNKNPKSWGYSYHGHRFKTESRHQFVVSILSQTDQVGVEKTYKHMGTFRSTNFHIICKRRAGNHKLIKADKSTLPICKSDDHINQSKLADLTETETPVVNDHPSLDLSDFPIANIETTISAELGERRDRSATKDLLLEPAATKDLLLEPAVNPIDNVKITPPQSLTPSISLKCEEKSIISPFSNFVTELSLQVNFVPNAKIFQEHTLKPASIPIRNDIMLSMLFNDQQKQMNFLATDTDSLSATDPFHSISDGKNLNDMNGNRIALLQTLFTDDISPLCNATQLCNIWPQTV